MHNPLSKAEKKLAPAFIDKAILAEFKTGLEKAEAVIQKWKNEKPVKEKLNRGDLSKLRWLKNEDINKFSGRISRHE